MRANGAHGTAPGSSEPVSWPCNKENSWILTTTVKRTPSRDLRRARRGQSRGQLSRSGRLPTSSFLSAKRRGSFARAQTRPAAFRRPVQIAGLPATTGTPMVDNLLVRSTGAMALPRRQFSCRPTAHRCHPATAPATHSTGRHRRTAISLRRVHCHRWHRGRRGGSLDHPSHWCICNRRGSTRLLLAKKPICQ
jgi:hypothetical protein